MLVGKRMRRLRPNRNVALGLHLSTSAILPVAVVTEDIQKISIYQAIVYE